MKCGYKYTVTTRSWWIDLRKREEDRAEKRDRGSPTACNWCIQSVTRTRSLVRIQRGGTSNRLLAQQPIGTSTSSQYIPGRCLVTFGSSRTEFDEIQPRLAPQPQLRGPLLHQPDLKRSDSSTRCLALRYQELKTTPAHQPACEPMRAH